MKYNPSGKIEDRCIFCVYLHPDVYSLILWLVQCFLKNVD